GVEEPVARKHGRDVIVRVRGRKCEPLTRRLWEPVVVENLDGVRRKDLVGPLIVVAIFEERPPYDCLSRLLPGDEVWVAITVDNPYAPPRFACRRERMKLDLRARAGCYATHSDAKEVA